MTSEGPAGGSVCIFLLLSCLAALSGEIPRGTSPNSSDSMSWERVRLKLSDITVRGGKGLTDDIEAAAAVYEH